MPIEIKSSSTASESLLKGLKRWLKAAENNTQQPRLICDAAEGYVQSGVDIRRWQDATNL